MDVGVEAAASPQCMVPLQARLELVNAIGQLNVSLSCRTCSCCCVDENSTGQRFSLLIFIHLHLHDSHSFALCGAAVCVQLFICMFLCPPTHPCSLFVHAFMYSVARRSPVVALTCELAQFV